MRPAIVAPHGVWLPLVFMAVCTAILPLGQLALQGIGAWTIMVVFFGVLAMPAGGVTRSDGITAAAIVAAVAILSPVLTGCLAIALHVNAEMRALMVLAACAPIAQSIGALTAILKLPGRSPAIAALITALISPIVLPMSGLLLAGGALPISGHILAIRTAGLVMAPAIVAFGLRISFPATTDKLRGDFRGLVILGLSMFAAARGPGLVYGFQHPALALEMTALACLVTLAAMLAGYLFSLGFGREAALAGVMATGMRNVPAAWAAIGTNLDPAGVTFMTLTVVPFYLVPVLMRHLVILTQPRLITAKHQG